MFKLKLKRRKKKSRLKLQRENRYLQKKVNTLELKLKVSEDTIKEKLYENFGIDTQKDETIAQQQELIKKKEKKIKTLKEMIENDGSRTNKAKKRNVRK